MIRTLASLAAAMLTAAGAHADQVTLSFTGHVTSLPSNAQYDLDDDFDLNQPCSGTIEIQTSTTSSGGHANVGIFKDAIVSMRLAIGDHVFESRVAYGGEVRYSNNNLDGPFQGDHVQIDTSMDHAELTGATAFDMGIALSDSDNTALPDNQSAKNLWPIPPLEEFEVRNLYISTAIIDGNDYGWLGLMTIEVDSLEPAVACVGDLQGDGQTNVLDFGAFATDFGCVSPTPDLITVEFEGRVSHLDPGRGVEVGDTFSVGMPFTGRVVCDRSVIDTDANPGQATFPGAITELSIDVWDGFYTLAWSAGDSNAWQYDGPFDQFSFAVPGPAGAAVDGMPPSDVSLLVQDDDGVMFDLISADQLGDFPDLSLHDGAGDFQIGFSDPSGQDPRGGWVSGMITSVRVVSGPGACGGDLDGDGDTDVVDFAEFASSFGCGAD